MHTHVERPCSTWLKITCNGPQLAPGTRKEGASSKDYAKLALALCPPAASFLHAEDRCGMPAGEVAPKRGTAYGGIRHKP
mmetsp:Transcript_28911/g.47985  ORF Transcript_28911/g.47985 Transcript_28911/m.47985 type:complete len:80 (+) Transcript_28911:1953-2192(+)